MYLVLIGCSFGPVSSYCVEWSTECSATSWPDFRSMHRDHKSCEQCVSSHSYQISARVLWQCIQNHFLVHLFWYQLNIHNWLAFSNRPSCQCKYAARLWTLHVPTACVQYLSYASSSLNSSLYQLCLICRLLLWYTLTACYSRRRKHVFKSGGKGSHSYWPTFFVILPHILCLSGCKNS